MIDHPIHNMTKVEHEHRWIMNNRAVPIRKGHSRIQTGIRCVIEGCGEERDVEPTPQPTVVLSEDQFEEFNPDNNGGSFYSWLAIKDLDVHYVWTIIEVPGDPKDNLYAIPGVHRVNRIDYVVCTKPWTDDIIEAVYMDRAKNFEEE